MKLFWQIMALCLLWSGLAANPLIVLSGNPPAPVADVTAPTLVSATVKGSVLTLNFSEGVIGAGSYLAAMDVDLSITGPNIAVTSHISGNGSSIWKMGLASPAVPSGTANFDFTGGANLIEDVAGNDLVAIVDGAVTNTTSLFNTDGLVAWLDLNNSLVNQANPGTFNATENGSGFSYR